MFNSDIYFQNKQEKKMNINLNSIIQEACETEKNNSNVIYHRDTRKRKYQNYFDSGNQHDYLLTGDIPNYDTEMVKKKIIIISVLLGVNIYNIKKKILFRLNFKLEQMIQLKTQMLHNKVITIRSRRNHWFMILFN